MRARLVECFGWPRGSYDLAREETPPEGAQPFRADLLALIQEGIETHWNAERVLADLAPRMNQAVARNRRLPPIEPRLRSDESVAAFLAALDGTGTLWSALQHARTPRAMAAAWLIDAIRAVDYGTPESREAGRGERRARGGDRAHRGRAGGGRRRPRAARRGRGARHARA